MLTQKKSKVMKLQINQIYRENDLDKLGLFLLYCTGDRHVFQKDNQVYFFEEIKERSFRLYDVISKRSFFL